MVDKTLAVEKVLEEMTVALEEVDSCAGGGESAFTVKFRQFGRIGSLTKIEVINMSFF